MLPALSFPEDVLVCVRACIVQVQVGACTHVRQQSSVCMYTGISGRGGMVMSCMGVNSEMRFSPTCGSSRWSQQARTIPAYLPHHLPLLPHRAGGSERRFHRRHSLVHRRHNLEKCDLPSAVPFPTSPSTSSLQIAPLRVLLQAHAAAGPSKRRRRCPNA